jgi:hypothetical protein
MRRSHARLGFVLAALLARSVRAQDAVPRVEAPPTRGTSTPVSAEPQYVDTDERSLSADEEDPSPAPPETRWYGWQTLTTDAVAVSLLLSGVGPDANLTALEVGMGTFGLGGPIVHVAHGRPVIAAASFLARVALPTAGYFVGEAVQNCHHETSEEDEMSCAPIGSILGGLLGVAIASGIDAAVFANEDVKPERPSSSAGLTVSPAIAVTTRAASVGVSGAF